MSAEAIARLREDLRRFSALDGKYATLQIDRVRALLDAHTEALDVLEAYAKDCLGSGKYSRAIRVLAKAGRR